MRTLTIKSLVFGFTVVVGAHAMAGVQSELQQLARSNSRNATMAKNSRPTKAANTESTTVSRTSNTKKDTMRFRAVVDLAPLYHRGVGGYAEFALVPKLTVGPGFAMAQPESETAKRLTVRTDVNIYSFRARYFLFGNSDETSIYLMGGAAMAEVSRRVSIRGFTEVRTSDTEFGPLAGAGVQFAGFDMGGAKMVFNAGATYHPGYANTVTAVEQNDGTTAITRRTIESSVFFETGIGILF
jgi:hypothetical protein